MSYDEKIQEIVDEIKTEKVETKMTSTPQELGFDSLDMVELGMAIDEEWMLELSDGDLMKYHNKPLYELARYVEGEVLTAYENPTKSK